MSTLLEGPETELAETDYHAFNRALWERLLVDPVFSRFEFRIETDRHGQVIMSPPPAPSHGNFQATISRILGNSSSTGKVLSECPISTREGVKAADVVWCSDAVWDRLGEGTCFEQCPEVCVEVLSPSNTRSEIQEKRRLYFEEGAEEFWLCHSDGRMEFFESMEGEPMQTSTLFPDFPSKIG